MRVTLGMLTRSEFLASMFPSRPSWRCHTSRQIFNEDARDPPEFPLDCARHISNLHLIRGKPRSKNEQMSDLKDV